MALGDIKNAPIAFEKSPVKNMASADRKLALGDMKSGPSAFEKSPVKMEDVNNTTDESIDSGTASSKYVNYSDIWCNNLALSDDEITRWIEMLNAARTMPMSPKSRPPTPPSLFVDQECSSKCFVFLILEFDSLMSLFGYHTSEPHSFIAYKAAANSVCSVCVQYSMLYTSTQTI